MRARNSWNALSAYLPRINQLAIASVIVAIPSWSTSSVTASDYGRCNSQGCSSGYSGGYGNGYGYSSYRGGYSDYGYRSNCNSRSYGSYSGYRGYTAEYPVLPYETIGWTYTCSLGDYACHGYYHPQYECWYYYYPQQRVFIPTQYIEQYPPTPILNQNFNDNDNDNDNVNVNDNQNTNVNDNQSTNITNINIGPGVIPAPPVGEIRLPQGSDVNLPQPNLPVPGNQASGQGNANGESLPPLPSPPQGQANSTPEAIDSATPVTPLVVAKRN